MRRLLPFLLVALVAPLTARAASSPGGPSTEVARIETSVQRIRQLQQLHPVKGIFLSDSAFDTELSQDSRSLTPPGEVQLDQREYQMLGFLTPHDDLTRILFHDLNPQVGGFYDYHRKKLYVRNHANWILGIRRDLIAHEYTHALQDQHYSLAKLMPQEMPLKYRNDDAVAAHTALVEGDAVVTQSLFVYRTYSAAELKAYWHSQSNPPTTTPIPKAIEREFLFPYDDGVRFVESLFEHGGMKGIDAAYRRLPTSTYEIMHPGAYAAHWRPAVVTLHGVQGFGDWTQTDDDVTGAFGYYLLLWQYSDKATAERVTSGYRGDRYIFLEKGDEDAMLLKSVWKDAGAASTARAALIAALRKRYPSAHVSTGSGTTIAGAQGGAYLSTSGAALTLTLAPSASIARQLAAAPAT